MADLITDNAAWFWLVIGILLLIGEMVIPGIYMLWIGLAAVVTAASVGVFSGLGFLSQAVIFTSLSVLMILGARRYLKLHPTTTDQTNLSRRGQQQVGKVYALATGIENGTGTVKIGDTMWTVEGPDLQQGTRVRIVSVEGAAIKVEADT